VTRQTYTAAEIHELTGLSTWAIYEAEKRGEFPVRAIHVGRRLLWPKAAIDAMLAGEVTV